MLRTWWGERAKTRDIYIIFVCKREEMQFISFYLMMIIEIFIARREKMNELQMTFNITEFKWDIDLKKKILIFFGALHLIIIFLFIIIFVLLFIIPVCLFSTFYFHQQQPKKIFFSNLMINCLLHNSSSFFFDGSILSIWLSIFGIGMFNRLCFFKRN